MNLESIDIPAFMGSVLTVSKKWLHLELAEKVERVQTLKYEFKHK